MKTIKKFIPVNSYDVPKMQAYLNSMASKGLFLKSVSVMASFERGKPEASNYRLIPIFNKKIKLEEEYLDFYEEAGWAYICTISNAFYVFKAKESHLGDIPLNPSLHYDSYKYLKVKLKGRIAGALLLLLVVVWNLFYSLFIRDRAILYIVKYASPESTLLLLSFAIFYLQEGLKNINIINNNIKYIKAGQQTPNQATPKSNYWPYFFNGLVILFAAITILSSVRTITASWDQEISTYAKNIPSIRLVDLEKSQSFDSIKEDKMSNFISFKWRLLAPEIYTVYEKGLVDNKMWHDQSGIYSPSLASNFYRLRFEFLAASFLDDLVEYELEKNPYELIVYQEILNTDFDRAVFVEFKGFQIFFAKLNQDVIQVKYYGYEDLRNGIKDIFFQMNNFE